jgi:hypothetical protein
LSIGRGSSVALPEAHVLGAEKTPTASHKVRSR